MVKNGKEEKKNVYRSMKEFEMECVPETMRAQERKRAEKRGGVIITSKRP